VKEPVADEVADDWSPQREQGVLGAAILVSMQRHISLACAAGFDPIQLIYWQVAREQHFDCDRNNVES
jgi:hypothetical protein